MPTFKEMQESKWDKEYREKGSLWHGPAHLDENIPKGARVLETGCGNGKTLLALLKLECRIAGVDISPKAVELCREAAKKAKREDAQIIVADICKLPFENESFEVVLAFHVLEHLLLEDRHKAVGEIWRVLAPGGAAVVRVFSVGDMRFGKGKEVEKNTFLRGNKLAYHYFSKEELHELFGNFHEANARVDAREVKYEKKVFVREKLIGEFRKKV
jgi:ubiquinone/menaquinone biosynthesis C-methylase UbiE